VHCFIARYSLLETREDRHRELYSSRLSGLSLGAFIKASWLNRIARPAILDNGLFNLYRTSFAVRSAITATAGVFIVD